MVLTKSIAVMTKEVSTYAYNSCIFVSLFDIMFECVLKIQPSGEQALWGSITVAISIFTIPILMRNWKNNALGTDKLSKFNLVKERKCCSFRRGITFCSNDLDWNAWNDGWGCTGNGCS